MTSRTPVILMITMLVLSLLGCSTTGEQVRIIDPWASEPAGTMAKVIAGFMCFQNGSSSSIRIASASAEGVDRVEIHEIVHEQGLVRMKRIDSVDVPANRTVCLQPEQIHFMLIGIDDTIRAGADIRLEIDTAGGEKLHTVLPQRALKAETRN